MTGSSEDALPKRSIFVLIILAILVIAYLLYSCTPVDIKVRNAINGSDSVADAVSSCKLSENEWKNLSSDTRNAVVEALFTKDMTSDSTWEDIDKLCKFYPLNDSEVLHGVEIAGFSIANINDFSIDRKSGTVTHRYSKKIMNNDGSVSEVVVEEPVELHDSASFKGYTLSIISVEDVEKKDVSHYYYYDLSDGVILVDINNGKAERYSESSSVIEYCELK